MEATIPNFHLFCWLPYLNMVLRTKVSTFCSSAFVEQRQSAVWTAKIEICRALDGIRLGKAEVLRNYLEGQGT